MSVAINLNRFDKSKCTKLGLYYGYPKCCINSFINIHYSNRSLEQELVHNGSGFIPCTKCSRKILSGKKTLETLIENRICSINFPNGDLEFDIDIYNLNDSDLTTDDLPF